MRPFIVIAAGMMLGAGVTQAQTPASGAATEHPTPGMTMARVESTFGAPSNRLPAVGQPPITRWQYPGFIVYFEHQQVIHTVIAR